MRFAATRTLKVASHGAVVPAGESRQRTHVASGTVGFWLSSTLGSGVCTPGVAKLVSARLAIDWNKLLSLLGAVSKNHVRLGVPPVGNVASRMSSQKTMSWNEENPVHVDSP